LLLLCFVTESFSKDNIWEPGEELYISDVELYNFGSIPLPAGATLTFPSTETIESLGKSAIIPSIAPGKVYQGM